MENATERLSTGQRRFVAGLLIVGLISIGLLAYFLLLRDWWENHHGQELLALKEEAELLAHDGRLSDAKTKYDQMFTLIGKHQIRSNDLIEAIDAAHDDEKHIVAIIAANERFRQDAERERLEAERMRQKQAQEKVQQDFAIKRQEAESNQQKEEQSRKEEARREAEERARYLPYLDHLKIEFWLAEGSQLRYLLSIKLAETEVQLNGIESENTHKEIERSRPRFDTEAIGLFHEWVKGDMVIPDAANWPLPQWAKNEPTISATAATRASANPFSELVLKFAAVSDSAKISSSAAQIDELIKKLSFPGLPNDAKDFHPPYGFVSGRIVRFAEKEGNLVLVVGPLVSQTVYNTLRVSEKQQAGSEIKEIVFAKLSALVECGEKTGAKHIAIIVGYGFRDFSNEYAPPDAQILGFVASLDDCHKFLKQEITQDEFIRRSQIFLSGKGSQLMKRIELTLE